ncbi:hypothetical protein B0H13DRAFT_1855066 [Mycena leptocephala]|nr:hypothetical protein B0H13DRAFT_1855066 [Mycena leptocephala]
MSKFGTLSRVAHGLIEFNFRHGCAGKDNECDGRYFFTQEGNSLDLNRASPNNRPGTATNTVRPEQRFAVLICVLVLVSSLGFHWRGHGTHAHARLSAKKDFHMVASEPVTEHSRTELRIKPKKYEGGSCRRRTLVGVMRHPDG